MGKMFYVISASLVIILAAFINLSDKSYTDQLISTKSVIEHNYSLNLSEEQKKEVDAAALKFNTDLANSQKMHTEWYMIFGDKRVMEITAINF